MGARRPALGQKPPQLRQSLAAPPGRQPRQTQDADADYPQRSRLPRAGQRRPPAFHDAAAPGGAGAVPQFPRRRPLGAQAAQQPTLAPRSVRLAHQARAAGRAIIVGHVSNVPVTKLGALESPAAIPIMRLTSTVRTDMPLSPESFR